MSDNERKGGIGTKDIPEDIADEGESGGESIKGENEKEDANHTILVFVRDPFLWP